MATLGALGLRVGFARKVEMNHGHDKLNHDLDKLLGMMFMIQSVSSQPRFSSKAPKPVLGQRFEKALLLANKLHRTQTRKGGDIPYVSHLLGVCSIVLENGGSEDEAIAALLHDAVEDQGGAKTRKLIQKQFGETVTAIVDGCSDTDVTPKPPWRERKETYLAHVVTAPLSVCLVSAADKLHNVRTLITDFQQVGNHIWERFKGGKDGTMWYYRALVEAYHKANHQALTPLVDTLNRHVTQLESMVKSTKA